MGIYFEQIQLIMTMDYDHFRGQNVGQKGQNVPFSGKNAKRFHESFRP